MAITFLDMPDDKQHVAYKKDPAGGFDVDNIAWNSYKDRLNKARDSEQQLMNELKQQLEQQLEQQVKQELKQPLKDLKELKQSIKELKQTLNYASDDEYEEGDDSVW